MATQQFSTPIDHTTDVGFRAWALELSNALLAVGLVRTADTGQANFATMTRVSNTYYYEIFRFDDALQATAPVFLKVEYGNTTTLTAPRVYITIGTGSNGSGTLTGVVGARTDITSSSGTTPPSSTITNYNTNLCYVSGHVGYAGKMLGFGTAKGMYFFSATRTTDSDGDFTGNGLFIRYGDSTGYSSCQFLDFANSIASALTNSQFTCLTVQQTTNTTYLGNVQAFKHYMMTNKVEQNIGLLTVLAAEVGANTTFSLIPIGSTTSRTYISLGVAQGYAAAGRTTDACLAMIWE